MRTPSRSKSIFRILLIAAGFCFPSIESSSEEPLNPSVEVEDVVCTYVSPDNGAGPTWCYGAPLLVRHGDDVFVSAMQTGADVPKLCNTRWQLFKRNADGWQLQRAPDGFREREPCPLVAFSDGRLFLSVNPSLSPPGKYYGPCDPHLLAFPAGDPQRSPSELRPDWQGNTAFTDHSYRGVASDGPCGEILLLNIHSSSSEQCWAFLDEKGSWSKQGRIRFPIRACYPQVALRSRAAHVLAIGDIVEFNETWRQYKREQTGREWDYVFRRLFYTWTPDIIRADFAEPIEIDNVDPTGGYILNLDLWLGSDGCAHLLYLKMPIQSALLRDKFFPNMKITTSLEYAVVKEGSVARRSTLLKGGEGESGQIPGNARFHATKDGKLLVIYYCGGRAGDGTPLSENRILQLLPRTDSKPVTIPLKYPFTTFFTACERGGSPPSDTIDLFGTGRQSGTLRYARIRL
jgi:hypothetical protein